MSNAAPQHTPLPPVYVLRFVPAHPLIVCLLIAISPGWKPSRTASRALSSPDVLGPPMEEGGGTDPVSLTLECEAARGWGIFQVLDCGEVLATAACTICAPSTARTGAVHGRGAAPPAVPRSSPPVAATACL